MKFIVGEQSPVSMAEGSMVQFIDGEFTIMVKMSFLDDKDVQAFKKQELRIALCRYNVSTQFFVWGIQDLIRVSDTPLDITSTISGVDKLRTDFTVGGYKVGFILIDGETDVVRAIRTVELTQTVSTAITNCCIEQADAGTEKIDEYITEVYKLGTAELLLKDYLVAGCKYRAKV